VQNLEFFKPGVTCASGKPQNFLWSAPVQNLYKSKKLHVTLRQHYNLQNLYKSSPKSRTHPAGCRSINPRKKAPNSLKLGADRGRFDKLWVDCGEGRKFEEERRKIDLFF
jgi:hypothetical protein